MLQVLYGLSDDQAEFQILDRRSFGRFLGLDDGDKVPDAKTIWLFREQLTVAGAVERLLDRFDAVLNDRGYLPMGGQIVDATVVEARRPRLTVGDDRDRRAGVSAKRTTSASIAASVGSAPFPSPTPPPTTAASSKASSIATTWRAVSGRMQLIAPPPTWRCSTAAASCRNFSGRSPGATDA